MATRSEIPGILNANAMLNFRVMCQGGRADTTRLMTKNKSTKELNNDHS